MHLHAAGIKVGARQSWVAVPDDRDLEPMRPFGAFTADLYALAEWLRQGQIEAGVMESTGVYRIPLSDVLDERGFEVRCTSRLGVAPRRVSGEQGLGRRTRLPTDPRALGACCRRMQHR